MKILITGAGGFLGHGLVRVLSEKHELKLMDIKAIESDQEQFIGDVRDYEDCCKAVEGVDMVVLSHMAARPIETPPTSFDVTVKGTANIIHAAVEAGVKRICMISSINTVRGCDASIIPSVDTPMKGLDVYDLSKISQEIIAEHYHRNTGMNFAILRVGYVVDLEARTNKYAVDLVDSESGMVDRYDLGKGVLSALECKDIEYEVFYLTGSPGVDRYDASSAIERLGWDPVRPELALSQ